MTKIFYTIIVIGICSVFIHAQQTSLQSLYMLNPYSTNPAYGGLVEYPVINAAFRKQWVGVSGSPIGQSINFHLPLNLIGGGAGIQIDNDAIGGLGFTSAALSYNYILPASKKAKLSFGASMGLMQVSLDGNRLRTPEGDYTGGITVSHHDQTLSTSVKSTFVPDASFGVFFKYEGLNAGISITRLLGMKASINNGAFASTINFSRNYHAFLSYKINITKQIAITPSVMVRTDAKYIQPEYSLLVSNNDKLFGGISFRGYGSSTTDAFIFIAGFKFAKNFTLAYAYDLTLSNLSSISSGSHEAMLSYQFNKNICTGKMPKTIYNPRML
jgi:type IX secretion system PorP/SprF family membrane protein